jgi:hypothetical protein
MGWSGPTGRLAARIISRAFAYRPSAGHGRRSSSCWGRPNGSALTTGRRSGHFCLTPRRCLGRSSTCCCPRYTCSTPSLAKFTMEPCGAGYAIIPCTARSTIPTICPRTWARSTPGCSTVLMDWRLGSPHAFGPSTTGRKVAGALPGVRRRAPKSMMSNPTQCGDLQAFSGEWCQPRL